MDEVNDVQALEKISSEVGESQIKLFLSSQCIKAQAFLVGKLKKQIERSKQISKFISSANVKLEGEIRHAELERRSMLLAQDTIKSANVELRKEWLLAKDKKIEITERIEIGVKKYEALWMECKQRFEIIPFVRKFIEATEKTKQLKNDIEGMENQVQKIYKDIETRKYICMNLDKERVIELANFMINELPIKSKLIEEKAKEINSLTKKNEDLLKEQFCVKDTYEDSKQKLDKIDDEQVKTKIDDGNCLPCSKLVSVIVDDDPLIPRLELADFDIDFNDINLDQVVQRNIAMDEDAPINTSPAKTYLDPNTNYRKDERSDEFIISAYVYKPIVKENTQCFSKRKLINILEDVKIDKKEAYNIVAKMNPEKFQMVHEISAVGLKDKNNAVETEDIEVIDLTSTNTQNIIIPPTQFLDITVELSQGSQRIYNVHEESLSKKRVSFDLRTKLEINEINEDDGKPYEERSEQNPTITSQLDVSAESDETVMKIKDLILKKHNLTLSPQFVYAKNNILQKNDDDRAVVTSKFFEQEDNSAVDKNTCIITDMDIESEALPDGETFNLPEQKELDNLESEDKDTKNIQMDCDEIIASSPKPNKENEDQHVQKPISGLLFTHGTQGIPDSLNVSMSTTGYEDSDFAHCIDSSLLLSPKADIPMTVDNTEVLSQDVPNFLSGLRKTGLSFFGGGPSSSKPDSSAQNQGNSFNFNFGGDDKKKRGGLFSMFN